jgi:hypothetical protein
VQLGVSNTNPGLPSSTDFRECIFNFTLNGLPGVVATLDRCILDHQAGTGAEVNGFSGGGLTLRHCVGLGTRIGNSAGFTSENSVYTRSTAPFWQNNGAILVNNLVVSTALVSNMTPGAAAWTPGCYTARVTGTNGPRTIRVVRR